MLIRISAFELLRCFMRLVSKTGIAFLRTFHKNKNYEGNLLTFSRFWFILWA